MWLHLNTLLNTLSGAGAIFTKTLFKLYLNFIFIPINLLGVLPNGIFAANAGKRLQNLSGIFK